MPLPLKSASSLPAQSTIGLPSRDRCRYFVPSQPNRWIVFLSAWYGVCSPPSVVCLVIVLWKTTFRGPVAPDHFTAFCPAPHQSGYVTRTGRAGSRPQAAGSSRSYG